MIKFKINQCKRKLEEILSTSKHCTKKGHPPFKCWRRPDAKCNECNQMVHEAVICKNKNQPHGEATRAIDQEEEEY